MFIHAEYNIFNNNNILHYNTTLKLHLSLLFDANLCNYLFILGKKNKKERGL